MRLGAIVSHYVLTCPRPKYAANPGLTPSFRRSLPETGCLSQGLPHGKRSSNWFIPSAFSQLLGAQEGPEVFHEQHETHLFNGGRAEPEAKVKGTCRSVD